MCFNYRFPFPSPKFIPQKTILELIVRLITVLPPNITRNVNQTSQLKEQVFLSAMIPGVHVMALNLLRGLLLRYMISILLFNYCIVFLFCYNIPFFS